MSYPDTSESETETNSNDCLDSRTYMIITFVMFLILIAFNACGLIIASMYPQTECYNNSHLISLATWLFIINAGSIGLEIIILLIVIHSLIFQNTDNHMIILLLGATIMLFVVIVLGLNIGGITELVYQFEACRLEVPIICSMTIATIVINTVYSFVLGYGVYRLNKH